MKGAGLAVLLATVAVAAQAQNAVPSPQERVAMLKQWLQASQAQMHNYAWVETTVVTVGGEEKARIRKNCHYAVDGTLYKVPIDDGQDDAKGPRGPLRKRIAQNKKEEMTEYMQEAAALVQFYIPPNPERIQASMNGGKFMMNPQQDGRVARLIFGDYLKPGDSLSVQVETPTNRLLGMGVSSYLDSADDEVMLEVTMGVLPDGTIFNSHIVLRAPAKDMLVSVTNSDYHKGG